MNVVCVQGVVRAEPHQRDENDGGVLVSFDLVVEGHDVARQTVPVTWAGDGAKMPSITEGSRFTVVGHVRRRFFRQGGRTVSRTDVLADELVPGAGVRAGKALARAAARITA